MGGSLSRGIAQVNCKSESSCPEWLQMGGEFAHSHTVLHSGVKWNSKPSAGLKARVWDRKAQTRPSCRCIIPAPSSLVFVQCSPPPHLPSAQPSLVSPFPSLSRRFCPCSLPRPRAAATAPAPLCPPGPPSSRPSCPGPSCPPARAAEPGLCPAGPGAGNWRLPLLQGRGPCPLPPGQPRVLPRHSPGSSGRDTPGMERSAGAGPAPRHRSAARCILQASKLPRKNHSVK